MINDIFIKCMRMTVALLLLFTTGCSGCSKKIEQPATSSDMQNTASDAQNSPARQETTADEKGQVSESDANNSQDNSPVSSNQADMPGKASSSTASSNNNSATGSVGSAQGSSGGNGADELSGGLSAKEAQEQAKNGLRSAESLAKKGKYTKAFQEVLTSWQGLQQHPDDPSSRALANELQKVLKDYGERLNAFAAENGVTTKTRKPLTVE